MTNYCKGCGVELGLDDEYCGKCRGISQRLPSNKSKRRTNLLIALGISATVTGIWAIIIYNTVWKSAIELSEKVPTSAIGNSMNFDNETIIRSMYSQMTIFLIVVSVFQWFYLIK